MQQLELLTAIQYLSFALRADSFQPGSKVETVINTACLARGLEYVLAPHVSASRGVFKARCLAERDSRLPRSRRESNNRRCLRVSILLSATRQSYKSGNSGGQTGTRSAFIGQPFRLTLAAKSVPLVQNWQLLLSECT